MNPRAPHLSGPSRAALAALALPALLGCGGTVSGGGAPTGSPAPDAGSRLPTAAWTRTWGTSAGDQSFGVATDADGSVVAGGYTSGDLEGSSAGGDDAFVTKFDADGEVLWTRQWGTAGDDYITGVAVDGDGNVFAGGYTSGALAEGSAGKDDAFVTKLAPNGTFAWARQWGTAGNDYVNGVAVDQEGSVLAAGHTDGNLQGPNAGAAFADAFVTKLGPDGTVAWSHQWGTTEQDVATGVAVDRDGNVLAGGYTAGSLAGPNAGYDDAFVLRLAPDSTPLWSKQWGGESLEQVTSVAVTPEGDVLAGGFTYGALQGTSAGLADAFVTRLLASGSVSWTRQWGTFQNDRVSSVALDARGSFFAGGYAQARWDEGDTSFNADDAFLSKVTPAGTLEWTEQWGTTEYDAVSSVAVDAGGNVLAGGHTLGDLSGPSGGGSDAFVRKFGAARAGQ